MFDALVRSVVTCKCIQLVENHPFHFALHHSFVRSFVRPFILFLKYYKMSLMCLIYNILFFLFSTSFQFVHSSKKNHFKFQVFTHAKVFFSIGGQHFNGEPVHFSYMPDTVMENARDVTIKLHHRIGKYVQVHLYFALRWIMLSEVTFVAGK